MATPTFFFTFLLERVNIDFQMFLHHLSFPLHSHVAAMMVHHLNC